MSASLHRDSKKPGRDPAHLFISNPIWQKTLSFRSSIHVELPSDVLARPLARNELKLFTSTLENKLMRRQVIPMTIVLFLGLLCHATQAQMTMQFPVSRDVGIDGWDNHGGYNGVYDKTLETEEFTNHGGIAPQVRGKKGTQHSILMDWDTEEINQWITDNTNPGDILSWTYNVYPFQTPADDVQIVTLESLNDWVEGDGTTSFTNFNWTEDTGAATHNFAVTYWKFDDDGDQVLDEDRSVPWIDDDSGTGGIDDVQYSVLTRGDSFVQGDPISNYVNSVDLAALDLEDAAFDFTFATVELDDELIDELLNNPANRGIVYGPINDGSINSGTNWTIHTRESSGEQGVLADEFPGPVAPYLEVTVTPGVARLQAGDADQDLDFDQLDLVKVQVAAKYLTGEAATWGDGDWDGAPGGTPGNPPAGNGFFDQLDIVSALAPGHYLTGPYAALTPDGKPGDEQTSLVYDTGTGELTVDSPASKNLTSINITSAGSKFIGDKPAVLDGAFDNYAADNIFKATFGGSFGDLSFGNVLPAGLSQVDVEADLSAVGSLEGGGDLGNVDLVYIPEPVTAILGALGAILMGLTYRRRMP